MSRSLDIFNEKLSEYKRKYEELYRPPYPEEFIVPDDIAAVNEMITQYQQMTGSFVSRMPVPMDLDIKETLAREYNSRISAHEAAKQQVNQEYENKVNALIVAHDNQVATATAKAAAGVQPLIDKHNELMSYKDKIEDLCKRYGISPSDIQVSTDITAEEYDALLTAAISGCKEMLHKKEAKFNPLSLLYKPAEWSDKPVQQIIAITLFAILFHNFGGIIALTMFIAMYASTIGIYKKIDKLRIAESMMYTPDFDKFRKTDEIEAIADVDTTEAAASRDQKLEELENSNPVIELSKEMQDYASHVEEITTQKEEAEKWAKDTYQAIIMELKNRVEALTEKKADIISKMKKFGDTMLDESPKCYPSYKYVLGKLDDVIEQRVEFPKCSCNFNPNDPQMMPFLKLVLSNILLDIKEKKQQIIIYDANDLGKDFAEFVSAQGVTKDLIQIQTSGLSKIMDSLRETVTANIRLCGQRTLDEVNAEAEEKGMVTRDYTVLFLISGYEKFYEESANIALLKNCHNYGLRIYGYTDVKIDGVHSFDKAYDLPSIKKPLRYTYELGAKVTATFADAVSNSKDGAIDYFTSIQEKYIPREKWGTWSSNKGIDLNFGLADGDPSKGFPMVLGDANVHLLMAGQSGAGKSAAINQMLLSLICKYSPKELMLVMIDFKNVEFSTFTVPDPKSEGKLSIIPHAKIMAGTKDGEYALSIFDFLIQEMERRQKIFGAVNQKKLEDYNNLMREQGHPEECLPRILLLIDEFQVMFTEVERKIVDLIQDRIRSLAKLARAFGCHMWFTSQSMSGTMSNDVKANFSMRAALRCTREVSSEIIGNGAAGEIKAKFGYLYTNDSTGQDPTRNILWRVPFVSTKNILKTMNEAAELYKSQGMEGYHAPFYDEDQTHSDKELFQFYEDHKDDERVTNPHLFVLGMRTNFSLNNAPVNFYIERGDFENVIIGGMEDHDLLNMTRTIMDNIQAHGLKMIVSCADEDAHKLLEIDTRLQGGLLKWSYPSIDFADWVSDASPIVSTLNKRLAMSEPNYPPLAIILYNWDKYPGFGVAENTRAMNSFKEILRKGPTVDMHFYLIIRTKGEIAPSTYAMFKHKICCLIDEGTSLKILDSGKGNKLPNKGKFGIYKRGNEEVKFKVIQHTFGRKLADKELKL